MSINCDIILRWDSMPQQRRAIGAALWRWCSHVARGGVYLYLDNQEFADLLAGQFPAPGPTAWEDGQPHVRFSVPGNPARDGEATLESLRRAIPSEGIEAIRGDGLSECPAEAKGPSIAVD